MSRKTEERTARITQQCHERGGMTYDLSCSGRRVSVHVRERRSATDAGDWRVEARTKDSAATTVVVGWGATRAEAFERLHLAWIADGTVPLHPLPWSEIGDSLRAVRAL